MTDDKEGVVDSKKEECNLCLGTGIIYGNFCECRRVPPRSVPSKYQEGELRACLDRANALIASQADENDKIVSRLQRSQALCEELANALQYLIDYQNGCPLPTYEKAWNCAMEASMKALKKFESLPHPSQSTKEENTKEQNEKQINRNE